jgi:hypothetical protein
MTAVQRRVYQSQLPKRNHVPTGFKTEKFKPEWSKIFPCIYYKDGAMFCKDCQDAGFINTFSIGCYTFMKDNIPIPKTHQDS